MTENYFWYLKSFPYVWGPFTLIKVIIYNDIFTFLQVCLLSYANSAYLSDTRGTDESTNILSVDKSTNHCRPN